MVHPAFLYMLLLVQVALRTNYDYATNDAPMHSCIVKIYTGVNTMSYNYAEDWDLGDCFNVNGGGEEGGRDGVLPAAVFIVQIEGGMVCSRKVSV